jgi:hypothetical protein
MNPKGELLKRLLKAMRPDPSKPKLLADAFEVASKERGIANPIDDIFVTGPVPANKVRDLNPVAFQEHVKRINSMPGSQIGEELIPNIRVPAKVDRLAVDNRAKELLDLDGSLYTKTNSGLKMGKEFGEDTQEVIPFLQRNPLLEGSAIFPDKAIKGLQKDLIVKDGQITVPNHVLDKIKDTELSKKELLQGFNPTLSGIIMSSDGNPKLVEKALNMDLEQITKLFERRKSLLDRVLFGIKAEDVDELIDINKQFWR